MASTFEDVWKRIRLYVPGAPVFLARAWVEDAYKQVSDYRGWAWSLLEGQIVWGTARSVAVTVTLGSRTVGSTNLFIPPNDAGRQFSVGTWPRYTIESVPSTSQLFLDQPYQGLTTGAVTGTIQDAYATLPLNFGRFLIVVDQVNQQIVPWWTTQEELALLDPTRTSGGPPRLLASRKLSTFPATLGWPQYEYWPTPSVAGSLQYYAVGRPIALADDYIFQGVLGDRTDVLETGALAAAAKWPGTAEQKNPYFNLALARDQQEEFQRMIYQLDLRDDDLYQQSISNIPWERFSTFTWAYDTHRLRETDATLGSYFGYTGLGW
jgi:hypothetical protein